MEIKLSTVNGTAIAEIISNEVVFNKLEDALDIMMNCYYQGADRILIQEEHLPAAFFNLSSGMAGELLQKFSTYSMGLTIVGDFTKYTGKSFNDFMRESIKAGRIQFLNQ